MIVRKHLFGVTSVFWGKTLPQGLATLLHCGLRVTGYWLGGFCRTQECNSEEQG